MDVVKYILSKIVVILLRSTKYHEQLLLRHTFFNISTIIPIIKYRKTSNISRTLVGNTIVDNSDVVGASPVGAAPTTSSFST